MQYLTQSISSKTSFLIQMYSLSLKFRYLQPSVNQQNQKALKSKINTCLVKFQQKVILHSEPGMKVIMDEFLKLRIDHQNSTSPMHGL